MLVCPVSLLYIDLRCDSFISFHVNANSQHLSSIYDRRATSANDEEPEAIGGDGTIMVIGAEEAERTRTVKQACAKKPTEQRVSSIHHKQTFSAIVTGLRFPGQVRRLLSVMC